jgi:hypothetical protein
MAEGIVYICRGRARSIDALGSEFEAWKQAHDEAMEARDVEDWVLACLDAHATALRSYRHIRRKAVGGRFGNLQQVGEAAREVFDSLIHFFEVVLAGVADAESRGFNVEHAGEFRQALAELHREREAFIAFWPWFDGALWQQAGEDMDADRVEDVGNVLHELQGRHPKSD